jgi:hypothetical protein
MKPAGTAFGWPDGCALVALLLTSSTPSAWQYRANTDGLRRVGAILRCCAGDFLVGCAVNLATAAWPSFPLLRKDAKRPHRERESLVQARTSTINRMKSIVIQFGVRDFNPVQRKAHAETPRRANARGRSFAAQCRLSSSTSHLKRKLPAMIDIADAVLLACARIWLPLSRRWHGDERGFLRNHMTDIAAVDIFLVARPRRLSCSKARSSSLTIEDE